MKKHYTSRMMMTAALLSLGCTSLLAQNLYHGNSTWENKSPYFPIVEEHFGDWNYKDQDGYGLKDPAMNTCASNARTDYQNYSTFDVKRAVDARQNKPNGMVTFFLDFCQIQPDCDTQSGTNFTLDSTVVNNDSKGPSWTNVSKGCISIYDNYSTVRPVTQGFEGDGAGSLTTSLIPLLERIQYTTSSYGNKRGFNLEIGYLLEDNTVYWDTVRYLTGNITTCKPDAFAAEVAAEDNKVFFAESNRGFVFEELFGSGVENVYVRIRPTHATQNRQIVRVHDLRLYGIAPDTDAATNPNPVSGIDQPTSTSSFAIVGFKGQYKLTQTADVVVYDFAGKIVAQQKNVNELDLTASPKGVYFVRATQPSTGAVVTKKILR